MMLVVEQLDIVILHGIQGFGGNTKAGGRKRRAGELFFHAIDVVEINVSVTQRMDQIPSFEPTFLGYQR